MKQISNWEMIVTDINDNKSGASSIANAIFDLNDNDIYNLELVSPIKYDKSVDTLAINNRVDFIYTIPKKPNSDMLKKQLAIIKTLNKGDTVLISGGLTHLNNGKMSFADFYEQYLPWKIDIVLQNIAKK